MKDIYEIFSHSLISNKHLAFKVLKFEELIEMPKQAWAY